MASPIPLPYRIFFMYWEPIVTVASMVHLAYLHPLAWLEMNHAPSAPSTAAEIPLATRMIITQCGTMMMFWAYIVGVVLRNTNDMKVIRLIVAGSLVGDFMHSASFAPLGWSIYTDFGRWGSNEWGNLGFAYLAIIFRISFLLGIGVNNTATSTHTRKIK